MTFCYYPGCTLKAKAKELDKYAQASAKALGIDLEEVKEWQCCGGAYPLGKDEIAPKLASARALISAQKEGHDLVTLCSACHNVIKRVNEDFKSDANFHDVANNYLKTESQYNGETNVIHYLEMLRDVVGFDTIASKVVNSFKGKKIAAYYGCLLLRPGSVMQMDNPENPKIMEDFIKAIGAEPVIYPYRNECCGGYVVLEDENAAKKQSSKVVTSADEKGAEIIITACPLCLYNLEKNGEGNLPVKYFTELLAEALGVKEDC